MVNILNSFKILFLLEYLNDEVLPKVVEMLKYNSWMQQSLDFLHKK